MELAKLIEQLQAALSTKLGAKAPVYMLINDELYEVHIQVNNKGELGPGSVLLTGVKVPIRPAMRPAPRVCVDPHCMDDSDHAEHT